MRAMRHEGAVWATVAVAALAAGIAPAGPAR